MTNDADTTYMMSKQDENRRQMVEAVEKAVKTVALAVVGGAAGGGGGAGGAGAGGAGESGVSGVGSGMAGSTANSVGEATQGVGGMANPSHSAAPGGSAAASHGDPFQQRMDSLNGRTKSAEKIMEKHKSKSEGHSMVDDVLKRAGIKNPATDWNKIREKADSATTQIQSVEKDLQEQGELLQKNAMDLQQQNQEAVNAMQMGAGSQETVTSVSNQLMNTREQMNQTQDLLERCQNDEAKFAEDAAKEERDLIMRTFKDAAGKAMKEVEPYTKPTKVNVKKMRG